MASGDSAAMGRCNDRRARTPAPLARSLLPGSLPLSVPPSRARAGHCFVARAAPPPLTATPGAPVSLRAVRSIGKVGTIGTNPCLSGGARRPPAAAA